MASKPTKKQDLDETSGIQSEKASYESKRRNPREPKRMDQIAKSSTFSSSFREPKTMDPAAKSDVNSTPPSEHKEGDTSFKTSMDSTSNQPGEYKATDLFAKNSLSSDKSSMDSTSNPPDENKTTDLCQNSMNSGKSSMDSTSNPPGECKAMDMFAKNSTSSLNNSAVENIKRDTNSCYSIDNTPDDQKPMEAATEVSMNSINNPCTRMLTNPETMTMASTTTATTTPPNTKTSDGKMGDSISSYGQGSFNGSRSDSLESSSAPFKPHTGGDGRWEAIQLANSRESPLGLSHFRLLKRLGYGDIGSVYLVELRGTNAFFAMKVMDKASLVSRNKLLRAQTEREILGLLDHPFLPTLYSYFETEKFYCLVMEFCSGGNLHSLRQKQPNKYFSEQAARFYASEVLLALEYLHMLGIVYRDLKPENVLVREEGHIMLSDFDLSLRCSVNPTLVKSSSVHVGTSGGILDNEFAVHGCIQPSNFFPRILPKKNRKSKSDFGLFAGGSLPELMAEPTHARSMSFVGTHEYLAPEIIRGEGHGSAVDWWTFGIFLYELLHGTTPFKGSGNRATLFNVVGQPLRFPDTPNVSAVARDLIRGLLVKDPQKRIAYRRGATEIKQHPFFEGVNWALVRCAMPPHVPDPVDFGLYASKEAVHTEKKVVENGGGAGVAAAAATTTTATAGNKDSTQDTAYLDFEYF